MLTVVAWALQVVSVVLSFASLVETFPWNFYRELDRQSALAHAAPTRRTRPPTTTSAPSPINGRATTSRTRARMCRSATSRPSARAGLPSGSGARAPRAPTGTAPAAAQLWGFGTPAQIGSGASGSLHSQRPTPGLHARAQLRTSPVADDDAGPPLLLSPSSAPWSIALAQATTDSRAHVGLGGGGGGLGGGNGAGAGASLYVGGGRRDSREWMRHKRTGSGGERGNCSKVSSVASSMVSLDSTAVD